MTNYIRLHRERRNWTREQLAYRAKTSVSQITKLERGERKLTTDWINRLAEALEVNPIALISAWSTEVIGQVQDDGAVVYKERGAQPTLEEIPSPTHAAATTMALEVNGDVLAGFAESGSYVFFDWEKPELKTDVLGKMCVVWCKDGRILVRRVFPGSSENRWTLMTSTGRPEYDVDLGQVLKISWIFLPPPQNGDK